jgi:hypothetical protein
MERIEGIEKNPKLKDTESSGECTFRMRQYRQHSEPEGEADLPAFTRRARGAYIMVGMLLVQEAPGEPEVRRCGLEVMRAPVLLCV